jgi:hypothetical protein
MRQSCFLHCPQLLRRLQDMPFPLTRVMHHSGDQRLQTETTLVHPRLCSSARRRRLLRGLLRGQCTRSLRFALRITCSVGGQLKFYLRGHPRGKASLHCFGSI